MAYLPVIIIGNSAFSTKKAVVIDTIIDGMIIRGEPERAPSTRGTGSGFICIYIYTCMYVCLWGDRYHFSEERVKLLR